MTNSSPLLSHFCVCVCVFWSPMGFIEFTEHMQFSLLTLLLLLFSRVWPFCELRDCSSSGSSVHGFSQARILEQVAIYFSRGSSWSRDQTCVSRISRIDRRFFTTVSPGKPSLEVSYLNNQFADVVVRPLEGERMSLKLCNQWTRSLGSGDQDSHCYPSLCFPEGGCTLASHYSECGPWVSSTSLARKAKS